jgi:NAD(P)-dependent dehydrogenase (short-subunit alcohol dehydrogenase family)
MATTAGSGRRFDGKVVLITGGARGQGRSHAVALAREGASIALVDIASGEIGHPPYRVASRDDLEQTAKLVEQAGGQALPLVADVREEEQVVAAVESAVSQFGGIDHLVSNAGALAVFQQSWNIPKVDWDASIGTNLTGHWLTCKYVIPQMIERSGNRGIVLVSSGAGIQALPYASDYCAAKYGVVGLGKTLANELGPYRIRVNILVPGAQDTPMIDSCAEANGFTRDQMLGQFEDTDLLGAGAMRPEEATTPAVLWLLSDDAKWVNGAVQVVDAGLDAKVAAGDDVAGG